jgi:N-methylhydantoinase A
MPLPRPTGGASASSWRRSRRCWFDLATLAATERSTTLKAAQAGEPRVWFADGWHQTPIYARDRLPRIRGPVILEQLDRTTVVEPATKVRQDKLDNLAISVG